MKTIQVNDKIVIHCKDDALAKYIKDNYVDEVTDPENEQFLDDLNELASDKDTLHVYLTYDTTVKDWYVDRYE